MKYKITIEIIKPPVADEKYSSRETIYEQIFETEDKTIVGKVAALVNEIA